ncbi:hypothetical protein L195_g056504 [Trifolium pratense]|uniref:Uncharacterized protein n=1 Tax=Trifolium pratense TaxID=57577 RepID=A0A2K3KRZ5_TRIPR|nr:hypothetical protein L195_g056504 [Trifolium pratense]
MRGPGGGMIFFKKGIKHGIDMESAFYIGVSPALLLGISICIRRSEFPWGLPVGASKTGIFSPQVLRGGDWGQSIRLCGFTVHIY